MEDQAKYLDRPKLDGNKTELWRVYYDSSRISFDLFLWLEEAVLQESLRSGFKPFKAYNIRCLKTITQVCKN